MPCLLFPYSWCDVSHRHQDPAMANMGLDTNRSQFFLMSPRTSPLGDIFLMTPGSQLWDDVSL